MYILTLESAKYTMVHKFNTHFDAIFNYLEVVRNFISNHHELPTSITLEYLEQE